MHDLGKLFVPEHILTKPTSLDDAEWTMMKAHPAEGARLVRLIPGYDDVAEIIRQHHERFDGEGYPQGLHRQQIRIEARIVAVCDTFAAMLADRPYKKGVPAAQALAEIHRCRGTQFDPDVADAFLRLASEGTIDSLRRISLTSRRPSLELQQLLDGTG